MSLLLHSSFYKKKVYNNAKALNPQGGTPNFSIRGEVRVNIWGLRFYKRIVFGVCEVQVKKNSVLGI